MKSVLSFLLQGATALLAVGAVSAIAAHIQLQFLIDGQRVKAETGQPGWKVWGRWLAPVEFYKDSARLIWRIRRLGAAIVILSVGSIILLAVASEVFGISFQSDNSSP